MEDAPARYVIDQFERRDFDDAMPVTRIEPVEVMSRSTSVQAPFAMKPGEVAVPRTFATPMLKCPRPVSTCWVPVSGLPGVTFQLPWPLPVR